MYHLLLSKGAMMRNSSHHSYERSNTIDEMDNLIGIAYIDRNCPLDPVVTV